MSREIPYAEETGQRYGPFSNNAKEELRIHAEENARLAGNVLISANLNPDGSRRKEASYNPEPVVITPEMQKQFGRDGERARKNEFRRIGRPLVQLTRAT